MRDAKKSQFLQSEPDLDHSVDDEGHIKLPKDVRKSILTSFRNEPGIGVANTEHEDAEEYNNYDEDMPVLDQEVLRKKGYR